MKKTLLGRTGLEISTIGFGAWGISGRDWGETDDKQSIAALHDAIDKGVNFIDTADTYGFGHSEKLIAKVLKQRGGKKNIIIATKGGNNFYPFMGKHYETTPGNPDYSKRHLIFAAEQSLRRLKIEQIDVYQLHSPSTEVFEKSEALEALDILKSQGKIRFAGWSIQSFKETEQADLVDKYADLIEVIQVRYNLLERMAEEKLLPVALKHRLGVIVRIPILFGLLAGKFNKTSVFEKNDHRRFNLSPEILDDYLTKLEAYNEWYAQYPQYSKAQLALRFCISHPACHVAIPGCKTSAQVADNIAASDLDFIGYEEFPKVNAK